MLTTGQFIDTARAREVGLINRVVPRDRLADETRALAAIVAAKAHRRRQDRQARLLRSGRDDAAEAYDLRRRQVMVENMLWRDTEEGISAFLEKRQPDWA